MTQNNYQKIGAGFCGTVWAQDLHGPAIKREDGGPSRSLANDFTMHQRALEALNQLPAKHKQFRIPQCYRFITPEDTSWWAENLPLFPPGYSPCNAISSERIPPFPEHIPALLLKKFCPFSPEASRQIMKSAGNRACLIRPYIGRQRTYPTGMNVRSRFRGFSLLNFPLHIDQMSELGIPSEDIDCYAAMMGEALATLHWLGEMDGNDVEFVLAPLPSTPDASQTAIKTVSNVLGEHTMWILDFDLCHPLTMDLEGVKQAVYAFFKNDPFVPQPNTRHWGSFRRQYLQTSKEVAHTSHTDEANPTDRFWLSNQFIELIERR